MGVAVVVVVVEVEAVVAAAMLDINSLSGGNKSRNSTSLEHCILFDFNYSGNTRTYTTLSTDS